MDEPGLIYDYASGNTLELLDHADVDSIGCSVCGKKTGRKGKRRVTLSEKQKSVKEALVCQDACAREWQLAQLMPTQYSASVGVDTARVCTAMNTSGAIGRCVTCAIMPAQIPVMHLGAAYGVCSHACQDVLQNVSEEEQEQHITAIEQWGHTQEPVNIGSVLSRFRKGYDTQILADQLHALYVAAATQQESGSVATLMQDKVLPLLYDTLNELMAESSAKTRQHGAMYHFQKVARAVLGRVDALQITAPVRSKFGNSFEIVVGQVNTSVVFDEQVLARQLALLTRAYASDTLFRGPLLLRATVARLYRMLWKVVDNESNLRALFYAVFGTSYLSFEDTAVQQQLVGGALDKLKNKARTAVSQAIMPKSYDINAIVKELVNHARIARCFTDRSVKPPMGDTLIRAAAYEAWAEGIWNGLKDSSEARSKFADMMTALLAIVEATQVDNAATGAYNSQRDCPATAAHTSNPSTTGKNLIGLFSSFSTSSETRKRFTDDGKKIVLALVKEFGQSAGKAFLATYFTALSEFARNSNA
jgi:hypothetical protein